MGRRRNDTHTHSIVVCEMEIRFLFFCFFVFFVFLFFCVFGANTRSKKTIVCALEIWTNGCLFAACLVLRKAKAYLGGALSQQCWRMLFSFLFIELGDTDRPGGMPKQLDVSRYS